MTSEELRARLLRNAQRTDAAKAGMQIDRALRHAVACVQVMTWLSYALVGLPPSG